ncbi:MAG: calcium/proton exchanger [Deltaproteobacteria bacterium]|nr:calcium/proton exchanger [Deltaproteobacteria bacterium]
MELATLEPPKSKGLPISGLDWLGIFVPVAFVVNYTPALYNKLALFACSCLALVTLSAWIGRATEHLAVSVGETIGGLLNASFSNLPEIIFGLIALKGGLTDLVKASMTGAIIGNLLLVMGHAMTAGGLRYKTLLFDRDRASDAATSLIIAAIALLLPTVYQTVASQSATGWSQQTDEYLSLWLAALILVAYVSNLIYTLTTHVETPADETVGQAELEGPTWSAAKACTVLAIASILLAIISDYVADTVEVVKQAFGLTELFLGVIVVATIGNISAQSTAVSMALKNKMELSFQVAINASVQIALLVTPLLVLVSPFLGEPMTLHFTVPETVAVAASVLLTMQICGDGKSNWLNGIQLLVLYSIIGVLFFYLPAS